MKGGGSGAGCRFLGAGIELSQELSLWPPKLSCPAVAASAESKCLCVHINALSPANCGVAVGVGARMGVPEDPCAPLSGLS